MIKHDYILATNNGINNKKIPKTNNSIKIKIQMAKPPGSNFDSFLEAAAAIVIRVTSTKGLDILFFCYSLTTLLFKSVKGERSF